MWQTSTWAPTAPCLRSQCWQWGSRCLTRSWLQASVSWFSSLRFYFNVSNSYVLQKLKIVVCPFTHKHWKRVDASGADAQAVSALQAQVCP